MNLYDVWFSKIPIKAIEKLQLLKNYGDTEEIYINIIEKKYLLQENQYINCKSLYCKEDLSSELNYIKMNKIHIVNYNEETYPDALRNYEDAPAMLYYKGNIEVFNARKNVSIVGARKNSYYGEKLATYISETLGESDVNIISGVARGIDAIAHRGALKVKGITTGILGCGIDVVYPKENKNLYGEISEKGVLISEFPCGTQPYSWNFPQRNRIISSLADLVIVIQAGERSGSLNTASYAANQSVDVMAVPGDVFSPLSMGTNKLIRDGAHIYTSMRDIFDLIGICNVGKDSVELMIKQKYKRIYDILSDVPMHINEIINITNIDITCLYELLFEMQTLNIINCIDGSFYVKAG